MESTKEMLAFLPQDLQEMLGAWRFEANTIGCSSSHVYRVSSPASGEAAYLKVQPATEDDMRSERDALLWLQGRLPVPRVLHYSQDGEMQYMLISEVQGLMAADEQFLASDLQSAQRMARLLARGLKMVHSVDVTDCPLRRPLGLVLAEAQMRVELGLIDTDDLQPENRGRSAQNILEQLINTRPPVDDLVFTHGDYCLPNIILQGDAVSGFVDLGRAGVADRYVDIALAVRSLRYNLGLEYGTELAWLFLKEYGLEQVDEAKISYYILLDELF